MKTMIYLSMSLTECIITRKNCYSFHWAEAQKDYCDLDWVRHHDTWY